MLYIYLLPLEFCIVMNSYRKIWKKEIKLRNLD